MNQFIVSDFFAKRAKLDIQAYEVEGVVFELMALTDDLKEKVELCESYEDMLSMAADNGLSYSRKRVVDDEELALDIDMLWGLDSMDVDCDPCIKYRVGEKVCEISGLSPVLEEQILADEQARADAEREKGYLDGDSEGLPLTESMGKIQSDMNAHNNIN